MIPLNGQFTISPSFNINTDAADQVQRRALTLFKASSFISYIELRPKDSAMMLVLRRRDEVGGVAIDSPTSSNPVTTESSQQMPLMMQLFTSPDFRSPLDPSTKVQSDRRIYAEVSQ